MRRPSAGPPPRATNSRQAYQAMKASAVPRIAAATTKLARCTSRPSISPVSRASVSAANSTMAPWAKLNTPEALKISTKPSATSE